MNSFFPLLAFSFLLASCAQEVDCSALKTGTYTNQTKNNGAIIITRTETQSIEEVPALDKRMVNSLEWTGDCSFTIQYESGDKPPSANAELPIDCKIVEVGEGYHVVRAQMRGSQETYDYRMEDKVD
jgi:hypothetical protein